MTLSVSVLFESPRHFACWLAETDRSQGRSKISQSQEGSWWCAVAVNQSVEALGAAGRP